MNQEDIRKWTSDLNSGAVAAFGHLIEVLLILYRVEIFTRRNESVGWKILFTQFRQFLSVPVTSEKLDLGSVRRLIK